AFVVACACVSASAENLAAAPRSYDVDQAVAVALAQNPEIVIARKKVVGAHGGFIEARSGFLPSLTSSGLYDKRQTQSETNLRQEDYNAIYASTRTFTPAGELTTRGQSAGWNTDDQTYDVKKLAAAGRMK